MPNNVPTDYRACTVVHELVKKLNIIYTELDFTTDLEGAENTHVVAECLVGK